MAYQSKMSSLLGQNEWLEFKRGILHICTEQNAKRAALRALIEFNCYRSLFAMAYVIDDYFTVLVGPAFTNIIYSNALSWQDPLRDPGYDHHQFCCPPRWLLVVLLIPFILLFTFIVICSGLLLAGCTFATPLLSFSLSSCSLSGIRVDLPSGFGASPDREGVFREDSAAR